MPPQAWAGSGWGGIHIPRIGQEVIIDFLEGDPDRPIITGRVYNGDNRPPFALPANQTQSGLKSHSTKGGGQRKSWLIAMRQFRPHIACSNNEDRHGDCKEGECK